MSEQILSLWGLFASSFISSTIAPGGSEAVLAFMVLEKTFNINELIMIATVGNTLGALTTWFLGVWTAKKYPIQALLDDKRKKSLALVRKWGVGILLLSWLPVIGDGLCFAGGWLRLPFVFSCCVICLGKVLRYAFIAYVVSS